MPISKQTILDEVARRGLVCVMNDTKWAELQSAVLGELAFTPPFQMKRLLQDAPEPEHFENDVRYLGDWSDECLLPFYQIEWIRIRPRLICDRGQLVAPEVQSIEQEFLSILNRYQIPHRSDAESIWIYGYLSDTGEIVTGS